MRFASHTHPPRTAVPPAWPEQGHDPGLYIRVGTYFHEAKEDQIIEHAQHLATGRMRPGAPILSPPKLKDFLRLKLAPRHRATFAAVVLDYRLRLIDFVEIFQGSVSGVVIHNREIVRELLQRNAGAVAFAKSDPGGIAEATETDKQHYLYLRDGLALLDIRVLDYFLVANNVVSLAQEVRWAEESPRAGSA